MGREWEHLRSPWSKTRETGEFGRGRAGREGKGCSGWWGAWGEEGRDAIVPRSCPTRLGVLHW